MSLLWPQSLNCISITAPCPRPLELVFPGRPHCSQPHPTTSPRNALRSSWKGRELSAPVSLVECTDGRGQIPKSSRTALRLFCSQKMLSLDFLLPGKMVLCENVCSLESLALNLLMQSRITWNSGPSCLHPLSYGVTACTTCPG